MKKIYYPKPKKYRLPNVAEWKYAALGGKYSLKYSYNDKINGIGWFYENSHHETKPCSLKTSNLLDLYDMNGNVGEWTNEVGEYSISKGRLYPAVNLKKQTLTCANILGGDYYDSSINNWLRSIDAVESENGTGFGFRVAI